MKKSVVLMFLSLTFPVWAEQENKDTLEMENPDSMVKEYRIEKPGTSHYNRCYDKGRWRSLRW